MSDKSYRDAVNEREVLEQLDALGIGFGESETRADPAPYAFELRPPETDDELEPYATVAETWEVDWAKALGCLLMGLSGLIVVGLVAWTLARVLRG